MPYATTTTVNRPHHEVLPEVRAALSEQGFGILSEIDLAATMKEKMGVEIAPQVILGGCRPPLALAALQAEPSIGVLLPCNVVVRGVDDQTTVVEAVDPQTMVDVSGSTALQVVADDAAARLDAALTSLAGSSVKEL